MTNHIADNSKHKAAKVAGILFLFSLLVPSLNWAFILSKLVVTEDAIATANNIMTHVFQYRIGITVELIMSVGLVVLGLALYIILKPVDKNIALLALLMKLVESVMTATIVLVSFIALQVAQRSEYISIFTSEQLIGPVGLILNMHTALFSIPMLFLGIDMVLFLYLFLKSRYIPRVLAGFGIISFALIFIHALMFILTPRYAMMPVNQIIFWAPSGIFEIVIGIWLVTKGLKVQHI